MIKCCIFDLDGTLLNTLSTITYYMQKTLSEYGLRGTDENEIRAIVGNGARNLVSKALARRGIVDPEFTESFYKKYSDAYDAAPYYLTEPYEGIPELLASLSGKGIKLGVLSNKPDFATCAIIEKFFGKTFDVVHGGRDGVPLKPAPDAVYDMLSELSASVSECAYIGDSEVDVKTGIASKIEKTIAVSWGFRTEDQLVSAGAVKLARNLSELEEFIFSKP